MLSLEVVKIQFWRHNKKSKYEIKVNPTIFRKVLKYTNKSISDIKTNVTRYKESSCYGGTYQQI